MQTLAPITKNRFQSLDFLRGVAILGILLMNIEHFALPDAPYHHVTNFEGINFKSWAFVFVFFEGTMRGLFSMLFGASCLLVTSKNNGDVNSADIYFRRIMWLFILGLVDAYILLWDGDILYGYAVCGLFLFTFRKIQAKLLIVMGLALALASFGRSSYNYNESRNMRFAYNSAMADSTKLHKKLTKEQKESISKWEEKTKWTKKDTAAINKNIRTLRGDFPTVFKQKLEDGQFLQKWTLYNLNFWDEILMMFIGMGLYKLGVFTNQISKQKYWAMLLLGYGIGVPLKLWKLYLVNFAFQNFGLYLELNWFSAWSFYDLQRVFTTIGHIGLLMLVFNTSWSSWLVKIYSKAGQMALSNYMLTSIISAFFFYGFGFGMFAKLELHQMYIYCVVIWVILLIFSNLWLKYFMFGPAEWLWRSLTYWKKQPLKRE